MVRHFEDGLKPFVKAKMDEDASHLDDYEELIAKAVGSEAKVGLQPSSYIRETNQQASWGNWLAHITAHKIQTQGAIKNHCWDKSKAKVPVPNSTQNSDPSDKARKDKKKKQHKAKQEASAPATRVNAAQIWEPRLKKKKL